MDLGVSVYLGLDEYSLEENIKYLEIAKKHGITHVFSSAHINEAKTSLEELNTLIDYTCSIGLKLSLDVSHAAYSKLNIPSSLYALRLDYGFSDEEIVEMSNNSLHIVELNASTISHTKLELLLGMGLNTSHVRLSYNFYPKMYSGHDIEYIYESMKYFHNLGFSVYAFIPSHVNKRPPMYEGLPSVETHRFMDLDISIEELKACNIDGVYFGDAYATVDEMDLLVKHSTNDLLVKVNLIDSYKDFELLFSDSYKVRCDNNSYILRFGSREINNTINEVNQIDRKKYSLTIDNRLFKRYCGELNIVLRDLPKDERCNVIGYLNTTDILINEIKNGRKFKFIK